MILSHLIILFYCINIIIVSNNKLNGWGSDNKYTLYSYTTSYLSQLRSDYKIRLINDIDYTSNITLRWLPRTWILYYQIDIRIDPCRNITINGGLDKDECCINANEAACQDNPNNIIGGIDGADDIHIAYFQNSIIPTCINTIYERSPNCGTYIEIHRSEGIIRNINNNENILSIAEKRNILLNEIKQVIADVPILNNEDNTLLPISGYKTTYIDASRLCAGKYELWWVIRTPSGPYVQLIKPFTVIAPSCIDNQILQ